MIERVKKEIKLIYSSDVQSQGGKRITYLDMVRGIAIFLVVVGHSGLVDHDKNVWLSSFHLPAFFLVSGVLLQLKKEEDQPLKKMIYHKTKGIMLPYIWFSFGALLIDFIRMICGKTTWELLAEEIVQTLTLQGYSVFWFLPVLLFGEIMALVLLRMCKKMIQKKIILALVITVISVIMAVAAYYGYHTIAMWGISSFWLAEIRILIKSIIAVALVSGGYFTGVVLSMFKPCLNKQKEDAKGVLKWIGQFSFLGLLVGGLLSFVNVAVCPYIQLMDLNNVDLGNPLLYLGIGLTGSLGLLLICRSIPNIPLITFYGQNSLIIMCTHLEFYILNAGLIIGRDVFEPLPGPDGLQLMIGGIISTMILEIPVILVVRILFPFVLGRKFSVKK